MHPSEKTLEILDEMFGHCSIPETLTLEDARMFARKTTKNRNDTRIPRCAATGKLRHRSERAAQDAMRNVQRKRNVWLRTYLCEHCHGFHMTSEKKINLSHRINTP